MILQFWKEEYKIKYLFLIDFLLCFCTFLLVPIIPIYMKDILYFNTSQIGIILGIPSIICCFFSGISYLFYKRFGTYSSILFCLAIDIITCTLLILKGDFFFILFIYLFKGFSSCIFLPIFKNLYINTLKYQENKNLVFKFRYLLICTSAIFAPIISNILYPISKNLVFGIIISINLICSSMLITKKKLINSVEFSQENSSFIRAISQKKSFFIFLIACIGILSVFSQFEGTFILTLDKTVALKTFSKLLILNSILGIFFQLFLIQKLKKISSYHSIIIGCIFFSLAYLSFWGLNKSLVSLSFSIVLFTLGETLVLPNIEIFTTEISNEKERVAIYSILEFKRLGFFLGPFLSGVILNNFSAEYMFLFFSVLSILSCIIFICYKNNINYT